MGVQLLAATVTLTYFIYYTHTWMSRHQFQTYSPSYSFTDEPQVFWSWDERTTGASSYIYISKTCSHYLYPVSVPTRCINLFTRKTLWKQLIKKFDFDWLHLLLLRLFASCAVNRRFIKFSLSLWHFNEKKKKKNVSGVVCSLFIAIFMTFHRKKQTSRHFNFQEWNPSASKVFSVHPHPSRAVVVCVLGSFSIKHSTTPNKCHQKKNCTYGNEAGKKQNIKTAVWHHCCACMRVHERVCVGVCVLLWLLMKCWHEEGLVWRADIDKWDTKWVKVSMNKPTRACKLTQGHSRAHICAACHDSKGRQPTWSLSGGMYGRY